MHYSNLLAEIWGITIAVVSLALLLRPATVGKLFKEAENEATMFFWGMVTLVIGVAQVLVHNVWALDWRLVITILGWLTVVKGLDLLFFPERMAKRWAKMENGQWRLIFSVMLLAGLVIAYLGFTAP